MEIGRAKTEAGEEDRMKIEDGEVEEAAGPAADGEEAETDKATKDGEEETAEATEGMYRLGEAEEEVAMSSGADPDSVDSFSREGTAGMAIIVPTPTTYRTPTTTRLTRDWEIHQSKRRRRRITIHGNGSSRGHQRQMILQRLDCCGLALLPF